MIASSTVKSTKKEPSGAEKKRAKIRREFLANIAICSPQDPEQETKKDESMLFEFFHEGNIINCNFQCLLWPITTNYVKPWS